MATALDEKDAAKRKSAPTDLESNRKANLEMLNQQLILSRQQQIEALKKMHDAKAPADAGSKWGGEGTIESNEQNLVPMPDVRGQTESQAVNNIRAAGLQPYLTYVTIKNPTSKYPLVRSVLPTTGTLVEMGQTVTLTIEVPEKEEEVEDEEGEVQEEEDERDERERSRRSRNPKKQEEELEKIQNEERVAAERQAERQAARNATRAAASESGAAGEAAALGEGAALAGEAATAAATAGEAAAVGEGAAVAIGAVATSEIWGTILLVLGAIAAIILTVIFVIALFVGMCNMDGWKGSVVRFGSTVAHYLGFASADCSMVLINTDEAGTGSATGTPSSESDQALRDILASYGIGVNKTCLDRRTLPSGGQTCLVGMNYEVIEEAITLRNNCTVWLRNKNKNDTALCDITITGGTEAGHEVGQCSHENGFKMDIRTNAELDEYIRTNFKSMPPRGSDPVWYDAVTDSYFVREADHWDTSVGCV